MAVDKRIPELPDLITVAQLMKLAIYDPATDTTYGVSLNKILPNQQPLPDAYNPNVNYMNGDIVSFGGKVYVSLNDDNFGAQPDIYPLNWQATQAQPGSAIVPYAPGVYTAPASVSYISGSTQSLYSLQIPGPFNSTDFLTELGMGIWKIFGAASMTPGALYPDTYFVSPLGDDSTGEKGNAALPYTPAGAAALADPGDTIAFLPGVNIINTNIAKRGVTYTTFGGKTTIIVDAPNAILFDYNAISEDDAITINGNFSYQLNANDAVILRQFGGYNKAQVTFRFSDATLWNGRALIQLGPGSGSSLYEGTAYMAPGNTAAVIRTDNGGSTGYGSIIKMTITNDSPTTALLPINADPFKGFLIEVNYDSSTVGFSNAYLGSCMLQLTMRQPDGASTFLSSNDSYVNAEGGTYRLGFSTTGTIKNVIGTDHIQTFPGQNCQLDAYLNNCRVRQDQSKSFVWKGSSKDSTLTCATTPSPCTLYGVHENFKTENHLIPFKIFGYIRVADGNVMYGNLDLVAGGKIVGKTGGPTCQPLANAAYPIRIAGEIRNIGTGPCILLDGGGHSKMYLSDAKLQTDGAFTIVVTPNGPGYGIDFKLYNNSYINKPVSIPEIVYDLGSAANIIETLAIDIDPEQYP